MQVREKKLPSEHKLCGGVLHPMAKTANFAQKNRMRRTAWPKAVSRQPLEVVPQAEADLLLGLVERLELARLAVEVVQARAA